ncbi:MAG: hypothetical protein ACU0B1_07195 [Thermohalobaculum sp.]
MTNWRDLRIGLLPVVLLAVVFSAVGFARSAQAQFAKDIINSDNGTKVGSITFPTTTGMTAAEVVFDLSIYTEANITSISWELDPVNWDVVTLSLNALKGSDPCPGGSGNSCSQRTLSVSPMSAVFSAKSCFGFACSGFAPFELPIAFIETAPAYACTGFEPPLADGPVTVRKNRVLPLKAELADGAGFVLGDGDLTAPPVVQVIYDSGISGEPPLDVSADALSAGQGTDGNLFVFAGSGWQFNLKTKNYEAPGTYTISMVSGDGAEYRVEPSCEARFVIDD